MSVTQEQIVQAYSDAVTDDRQGIVAQTGNAKFAAYSPEEKALVPDDVIETSFGCGNPVAFADVQPGQTVLDLGCGGGFDLILAARKVGATGKVIGVDMTDKMLDIARQNIARSGLTTIELRKGQIEALPLDSGSVDWVISNCVINLSPNKPAVFREIARVLKPGGQMLVSDIVAESLPFWVRRSGLLTVACAGGAISEAMYLSELAAAGFATYRVVAREYYEPVQMASVAMGGLPSFLANHATVKHLLTQLAKPISKRLWSARIRAAKAM
jgi:SAM-dependent methyltransferase